VKTTYLITSEFFDFPSARYNPKLNKLYFKDVIFKSFSCSAAPVENS